MEENGRLLLDRSLIAGLPSFAGVDSDDLDFILSAARSLRFAKDSEIFTQGAAAQRFFLLLAGHVRAFRTTPNGERVIARYINEGELFGIAVTIGRNVYPASATAVVDCIVLAWPNRVWPDLALRVPNFSTNVHHMIGDRLQETQARVVEMATQPVEQRIAGAVLRLARESGKKTEVGIEIGFPIRRQEIAEMTGTTLHAVSRVLSAWEQKGILRNARQKVTVRDFSALLVLSGSTPQN